MLSQTGYTKKEVIEAGINKKDVCVRTPFDNKRKGWGNPSIVIYNSENYCTFRIIRKLLKNFEVWVSIKDKKPVHLIVNYHYGYNGKLKIFDLNKNEFIR
jgi:hypothetical protein